MHTFAEGGTALVRIGGNPHSHRLDEDLQRKSGATFSNERVDNGILGNKYPKMSGGLREPLQ